jgi:tRNA threonylcarbamoyladenosine biosynthesis protein TsaB
MNVLAIDTSQTRSSVAAIVTGSGAAQSAEVVLGGDSSHLVEVGRAVKEIVLRLGTALSAIERIALVSGPGSFTGLRIGMAYAKGLHAALHTDIVTISSLELLAVQVARPGLRVCPMVDARREEVYAALYAPGPADPGPALKASTVLVAPCAAAPAALFKSIGRGPTLFVGSGAVRYRGMIEKHFGDQAQFSSDADNAPSTLVLCGLAREIAPLTEDAILRLEPFYIRPSDATLKPLRAIRTHE